MGRYCNLACIHCHVESGPNRTEMMSRETVDAVLRFLASSDIPALDITGGAPELHPNFDYLVESAIRLGRHVMDRCNLTVIFEPGKNYLPEFFKRHRVELVCSLPCYSEENVDRQRGKGTFELSIRALQIFNELGYGREEGLDLNLVYNPVGPHLPPPQLKLEQDYKEILNEQFGIVFNQLYCLSNMPITRYATHLKLRGEYESLHEPSREQLQSIHARTGDVPQSYQRRLGRLGIRLRFQPDARSPGHRQRWQSGEHCVTEGRAGGTAKNYHRRSLLCLYRWRG